MLTATSCISLSRAFKPSEKQWTLVRRQRLSSLLEELVQQRRDRATSIRTVIPTNATEETASMASSKDDVVGTVVTPSIVNKPWLRTTAVIVTLLLASTAFQKPLPDQLVKLAHVYAFAAWFGSSIWVLLLSPKIMFTNLGRQTFGRLQAKLFPQYFGFSVMSCIVLLGTKPWSRVSYVLLVALVSNLVNWLFLEPIISKCASQRYALENEVTRDEVKIAELVKTSSRYHGLSSMIALIALCCAIAYGFRVSSMIVS